MKSSCIREASQACFNGFGLSGPQTSTSRTSAAASRHDFEVAVASSMHPNSQFTNHEYLPSLHESFAHFTKAFPQYSQTNQADKIREQEYYHLSLSNRVCLDYIGHSLFSYHQQQNKCQSAPIPSASSSRPPFNSTTLEQPFFDISYRSVNLYSQIQYGGEESELESKMRKRIMDFMNISEDDYTLVFSANQSSAFKLLAESYPFQSNRNLLTVYDHENEAVKMMIESSKNKGARVMSAEFSWPALRIQSGKLLKKLVSRRKKRNRGLFVFPLLSRICGARYSYLWMTMAHENGWHVLLDAGALGAKDMESLGLSLFKPDFLVCSFFKVFGENPSGFGCLLVKKSSASLLKDTTTASSVGIVKLAPATKSPSRHTEDPAITTVATEQKGNIELKNNDALQFSSSGPTSSQQKSDTPEIEELDEHSEPHETDAIFEKQKASEIEQLDQPYKLHETKDITSKQKAPEIEQSGGPFESDHSEIMKGVITRYSELECRGLDHADSLGLILIKARARYLINWLVNALMSLQHPHTEHGLPLVRIYGPKIRFDRGPAVAFNVVDWKGEKIDPVIVQKLADRNNISLSYGFLQHIWFSDKYGEEKVKQLETRTSEREGTIFNGKREKLQSGTFVVIAALGFLTNFEDMYRLWAFISKFLDADFVEKERWRYTALNQKTIEV